MPLTKPYKKLLLLISVWQYGFQSVMGVEDSLKAIILCLKINSLKTQALVVKMLAQACIQSEYYERVVEALQFYTKATRETKPFEMLVTLMYQQPITPQFQTLCLIFFNSLISITPTFNLKVFHQQEIEDAGLDVEHLERTLEGMEAASVRQCLKTWQENYINVQNVMDEFVSLRERTKYLRDEVDLLQTKLEVGSNISSPSFSFVSDLDQIKIYILGNTDNMKYKLSHRAKLKKILLACKWRG